MRSTPFVHEDEVDELPACGVLLASNETSPRAGARQHKCIEHRKLINAAGDGHDSNHNHSFGGPSGRFRQWHVGLWHQHPRHGIWLYVISPPVAASLVIICSIISQLQALPLIWHTIQWKSVLPYIIPCIVGIPMGTILLSQIDPKLFKLSVGLFLVIYAIYALTRRNEISCTAGGRVADGVVGFGGGVLGGLAGVSGPPIIVWTDIRGYAKEYRRSILQAFNTSILLAVFLSHAFSGHLTKEVGWACRGRCAITCMGVWSSYSTSLGHSI
jgi:uncharacterized protein